MNYYQFHIGDYISHTSHLSDAEDIAYRRMLDLYYMTEMPLPDAATVARRVKSTPEIVQSILSEFFIQGKDGWRNKRCDAEIDAYQNKISKASAAGRASVAAKKANKINGDLTDVQRSFNASSTDVQLTNNHKPITNNQKPIVEKSQRGSRLANDWVLPEEWKAWANKERPDLDAKQVFEQFRDYWCAKAGKDAIKLDWQATWRNWVRNQKAVKPNFADNIRTTIPASNEPDAALEKIKADERITRPPTLAELAKMAELRKAKA